MFKLEFKAKTIVATKNSKDNYYMVGFADDKYNYKNYILFQRPIMLDNDDDPEADLNGLYAECNGDICYNACESVRITNKSCVFIVQDSTIIVDLENIKINKRFIEYSKCIFKDLLVLDI
ncbi:Imm10 family immunity protein [Prevotella pallens]|uniref:Imm10 family immunity protein n=1 Tax=Prevotella pallens TaxID=60133 RepID=UPI001CB0AC12|nr:Imm10 family immunity protein [Prevotella pallens]MBF1496028.1 hypothetical protein [Prevotella pallens]